MALLFWSTEYEAERAQAEILPLLRQMGARRITHEYSSTGVAGMSFELDTDRGRQEYLLPVRVEAVQETLAKHAVLRGAGRQRANVATQRRHAEMVAWRTLLEWVKVQAALIETAQASPDEVMLPYMLVAGNGTGTMTLYEQFKLAPALPAGEQ